jgi:acetylornithine/N-succinyldiaminopimelate aminotransferase
MEPGINICYIYCQVPRFMQKPKVVINILLVDSRRVKMSKKEIAAAKKSKTIAKKGHNSKAVASPKKKPVTKKTKDLLAIGKKYYSLAYKPREMIVARGAGAKIWDTDGNEYIDFGSGISVTSLGHHNKKLIAALTAQAQNVWHTSNIFFTEPTVMLAEELVKASKFAKRAFLTNSGAEANEAAIKIARKYAADKGRPPEKREIITFIGSFHGRTLATITATAQPKYQAGFEPMPQGFTYVKFNDFAAIEAAISDKTCAVLLEVVQGESGITPVAKGFLKHVQDLCHKHDALLMLDQVQDGMMRTGKLFSHFAEEGVKPDVVTLAKALGGGIPIGAMLAGEKVENTFQFGNHGSTFGGNPLACAVARVVLKTLQSKELAANVNARGKQLVSALTAINKNHQLFAEVRGRGLMIGAELKPEFHGKAGDICELARKHGVLVLQAGPNVLRFLPPLIIKEAELAKGISRLEGAISEFLAK